ncbi:MAG: Cys-tRNA(Pro) deacylase [Candidatus Nanopelagicales bacterium]
MTPATRVLAEHGITHVMHVYPHDERAKSYGAEAAEALGISPRRVFKTLVLDADGRLVVAILPVADQLDLKALAAAVGSKRAKLAAPPDVRRATGYVLGGVSPLGQKQEHPTVLDDSALDYDTILVSGGRRGLDVELSPQDLIELTNARVAPIAR